MKYMLTKILFHESQVQKQTHQIKRLTYEVDQNRLKNISKLHKNSELTETISKEKQLIKNNKANKSKAKKGIKRFIQKG